MPTPFMHLHVAEQILAHTRLSAELHAWLSAEWPAFYFGSVAADYQWLASVPREASHFYTLPPARDERAHVNMLAAHPELADATAITPAHAAFVAAYSAHLMLDVRWFHEVLIPYFVQPTDWDADHHARFLVHNILLTYLDQQSLAALPKDASLTLAAERSQNWLPFADDAHLDAWQDMLVAQLEPGGTPRTIEIYAQRLHMTPAAFAARLQDERWMMEHVFTRVPLRDVQKMLTDAVDESVSLISDYWQHALLVE